MKSIEGVLIEKLTVAYRNLQVSVADVAQVIVSWILHRFVQWICSDVSEEFAVSILRVKFGSGVC